MDIEKMSDSQLKRKIVLSVCGYAVAFSLAAAPFVYFLGRYNQRHMEEARNILRGNSAAIMSKYRRVQY